MLARLAGKQQETTSRKPSTAPTSATRIGSSSNIKQWSELARTREGNVTVGQVLDFGAQKTTRRRDKKSSRILQPAENKPKLKLEVEKVEKKKPSKSPLMKEKIRKFEPKEHLSKKEDDSKKPKEVNKHNISTEVEKNSKKDEQPILDRPARNGKNTSKKGGRTSSTSPSTKNKHNLYSEDEKNSRQPLTSIRNTKEDISLPTRSQK